MAMIVCHGPKGGAGTTFIAAHLATGLAEAGADVTVLTVSPRDTLALHFGLQPALSLPSMTAPVNEAVVAGGINLRHYRRAPVDPDFIPMLRDLGYLAPGAHRVLVLDVPAGEQAFGRRAITHACAHVCPLNAAPDTLALLPAMFGEAGEAGLARTAFVVNALDETRRLSRHGAAFIRELTGPRLIGRVRLDEAVPEAIAMLQPLARYAPASAALADVRLVAAAMVPALDNNVSDAWIAPAAVSRAA
ncbi:Cellulose biosynthesis protein BcsQ [Novosphingobium sp. CF614]|uniref:cellulose synthase operon protein YhjQ/BcsQ n=1 Tax=Novosphingobium sp. CF614 TaxID=1884364 RepID=UPI0008F0155E|nr:cellulose synthase operon protein YhjQ/BcsQ [Novosphingobium sp. CF614]SFF91896.1 Cellulose biosynthesis protein BcsQ [Novosphingobium sp. CF614]